MEAYLMLSFGLVFAGACAIYFAHKQAYEKGITDAVLMHREGREERRGKKLLPDTLTLCKSTLKIIQKVS
mgnify:CR=1 FL=1